MAKQKVLYIDDRAVRRYLLQMGRDSQRRTMFAAASAKAGIPMRKEARQEAKKSLKHEGGAGRRPLAKFHDRTAALRGAGYKVNDRKKKTINLIRVRRGKRKYRGSAWIVGGSFANLVHHNKGRRKINARSKGIGAFPVVLKSGEVKFVSFITTPRSNKYLDKAFSRKKGQTLSIWKAELRKAVIKHATKYGDPRSKVVRKLLT